MAKDMNEVINIKIAGDSKQFQSAMEEIQNSLSKLKGKFKITTNNTSIEKQVDKIKAKIDKINKNVKMKIDLDTKSFYGKLHNLSMYVDKYQNKEIKIKAGLDTSGILSELKKVNNYIQENNKQSGINIFLANDITSINSQLSELAKSLKEINKYKNTSLNLNVNSAKAVAKAETAGVDTAKIENSGGSAKVDSIRNQYKTLAQEARQYAKLAEQAWREHDDASYRENRDAFQQTLDQMVKFKKGLGNSSFGSEKGIYTGIARSLDKSLPLYDKVIEKIKQIKLEQEAFNASVSIKSPKMKPIDTSALNSSAKNAKDIEHGLVTEAQRCARLAQRAWASGDMDAFERYKQQFIAARQQVVNFQRSLGTLTIGKEKQFFESMIHSLEKTNPLYDELIKRVRKLNSEQEKFRRDTRAENLAENADIDKNPYQSMANTIRFIGRSSKGVGSFGEAVALWMRGLEVTNTFTSVAMLSTAKIVTSLSVAGASVYVIGQGLELVYNILSSIGDVLRSLLAPGIELMNTVQRTQISLEAGLMSIGYARTSNGLEKLSEMHDQLTAKTLANQEATYLMNRAMKEAATTALNLEEILRAMSGTQNLLMNKGMTAEQAQDIVFGVAGVAKTTNLSPDQILQETRDLAQGTISSRSSQVAQQLGITGSELAQYKDDVDGLYNYLMEKFKAYGDAMRKYSNTSTGALDQLVETWQIATKQIVEEYSPFIVDVLQRMTLTFGRWGQSFSVEQSEVAQSLQLTSQDFEKFKDAYLDMLSATGSDEYEQKAQALNQLAESLGLTSVEVEVLQSDIDNLTGMFEDEDGSVFQLSDTMNKFKDALVEIAVYAASVIDAILDVARVVLDLDSSMSDIDVAIEIVVEVIESLIAVLGGAVIAVEFLIHGVKLLYYPFSAAVDIVGAFINVCATVYDVLTGLSLKFASATLSAKAFFKALTGGGDVDFSEAEAMSAKADEYFAQAGRNIISSSMEGTSAGNFADYINDKISTFSNEGQYDKFFGGFFDNQHGGSLADKLAKSLEAVRRENEGKIGNPVKSPGLVGQPSGGAGGDDGKKSASAIRKELDNALRALRNELKDRLADLKDILAENKIAYDEGFMTLEDYLARQAENELQQAQAKLDEANRERSIIEQYADELNTEDYERKIDDNTRTLKEATRERDKGIKAVSELGKNLEHYSKQIMMANTRLSRVLSSGRLFNNGPGGFNSSSPSNVSNSSIEDAINQALYNGVDENDGALYHALMDNGRVGCVEAAVKLGKSFSSAFVEAYERGILNTEDLYDFLVNEKGIPVGSSDDIQAGDTILFNDFQHAMLAKNASEYVGNSSNNWYNGHESGVDIFDREDYWGEATDKIVIKTSQFADLISDTISSSGDTIADVITDSSDEVSDTSSNVYDELLKTYQYILDTTKLSADAQKNLREQYGKILQASADVDSITGFSAQNEIQKLLYENAPALQAARTYDEQHQNDEYPSHWESDLQRVLDDKIYGILLNLYTKQTEMLEYDRKLADNRNYINAMNGLTYLDTTLNNIRSEFDKSTYRELYQNRNFSFAGEPIRNAQDNLGDMFYKFMVMMANSQGEGSQEKFRKAFEGATSIIDIFTNTVKTNVERLDDYANYLTEADSHRLGMTDLVQERREQTLTALMAERKSNIYGQASSMYQDRIDDLNVASDNLAFKKDAEQARLAEKQTELDILVTAEQTNEVLEQRVTLENEIQSIKGNIDQFNNEISAIANQKAELELKKLTADQQRELNDLIKQCADYEKQLSDVANQAIENGLVEFLTEGIQQAQSFGEAVSNMLLGIVQDLNKFFAKQLVMRFMSMFTGNATEYGDAPIAMPVVGKAEGGYIGGRGTSTSDSIASMLSNGEYVIKASSVKKYGLNFLNAVNNGEFGKVNVKLPHYAEGGSVGHEGYQSTARGLESFSNSLASNVSTTNKLNIALVRDEREAMESFMRSGDGQRIMVDFARKNASVTSVLQGI